MKLKWEKFLDEAFYDLWAVRPVGDKTFNSPRLFHFASETDAEQFRELAEKAFVVDLGDMKSED